MAINHAFLSVAEIQHNYFLPSSRQQDKEGGNKPEDSKMLHKTSHISYNTQNLDATSISCSQRTP